MAAMAVESIPRAVRNIRRISFRDLTNIPTYIVQLFGKEMSYKSVPFKSGFEACSSETNRKLLAKLGESNNDIKSREFANVIRPANSNRSRTLLNVLKYFADEKSSAVVVTCRQHLLKTLNNHPHELVLIIKRGLISSESFIEIESGRKILLSTAGLLNPKGFNRFILPFTKHYADSKVSAPCAGNTKCRVIKVASHDIFISAGVDT